MRVKSTELGNTDCVLTNIRAYLQMWDEDIVFDYEELGRRSHLLFYMLDNEITYSVDGEDICVIKKNDIIFLPSGMKYTSTIRKTKTPTRGIGVIFDIATPDGEEIEIDSDFKILAHDASWHYYKKFYDIYLTSIDPYGNFLGRKASAYSVLNDFFSPHTKELEYEKNFHDIFNAIHAIEYSPEINYSNEQLAQLCFMSTSSFLRKFKSYSGGFTPLQYRNSIRLFQAEEMINTSFTIDEIAQKLGFYDGAHLCKIYKRLRGHTLKKRGKKDI